MRTRIIGIVCAALASLPALAETPPNGIPDACQRVTDDLAIKPTSPAVEQWAHSLVESLAVCPPQKNEEHRGQIDYVMKKLAQDPASRELRFDLLDSLHRAGWKTRSGSEPEDWWLALSVHYLEKRDKAGVRSLLRPLQQGDSLLRIRIDKRFDGIVPQPSHAQIVRALQNETSQLQVKVMKAPRSLETRRLFSKSWRAQGKLEEALAVVDSALAKGAHAFDDPKGFPWLHHERALVLRDMGRFDESVSANLDALEALPKGEGDAGLEVGMGCALAQNQRPEDAIKILLSAKDYGEQNAVLLSSCLQGAELQLNRAEPAQRAFALIEKHRTASWSTYTLALLRQNRLDDAAASMIERLHDPDLRGDALVTLQDYPKFPPLPSYVELDARYEQLHQRRDVQAAALKVGRLESFDFPEPATP